MPCTVYPEADDIASKAVMLAFEKIETFRGESSFLSWVLGIASKIAMNVSRQLGKASMPFVGQEACDSLAAQELAEGFDDESCLRTWALEEAMSSLKDEEQEVIKLRILEQQSSKAVADALGKSAAAVRQMERRACIKMRNYLCVNGYAGLFPPMVSEGSDKPQTTLLVQNTFVGQ